MILVAMMAKDLVKDLNDDDKKKIVDLFEQLEDYINDFNLDPSVLMNVGNIKDLESISDIEVVQRLPIVMESNEFNKDYLDVKKDKMGHLL